MGKSDLAGRMVVALCFVILLCPVRLWAAAGPTEAVKASVESMLVILKDAELRKGAKTIERRAAMRKVVEEIFDFQEMGRRAVARHWIDKSPQQRAEFAQVFSELLWRAYVDILEKYENEQVQFVGETIQETLAEVRTQVTTRARTDVTLDYRLTQVDGKWRVYDVVVQGVSLVANYRTQFDRILMSKSWEDMIATLKGKQSAAENHDLRKQRDSGI